MNRFVRGLAAALSLGVVFSAIAGGIAHTVGGNLDQEVYLLAIGDHLPPGSPVESWLFGPFLIGAFVSWWVGLIAAPVLYAAGFAGVAPWPRLKQIVVAALISLVLGAVFLLGLYASKEERDAASFLMTLLQFGYLVLGVTLAALAYLLRRARRGQESSKRVWKIKST